MKEVLGLDIGGVIIRRGDGRSDTSLFGENYVNAAPVAGAFDGIRAAASKFGTEIHLVSKARPSTQRRTLEWMDHNGFYDKTGVDRDNVHFVLTRGAKAGVASDLSLTHFVDDKAEVLSHLLFVPKLYLFDPVSAEMEGFDAVLNHVTLVENWPSLTQELLGEQKY